MSSIKARVAAVQRERVSVHPELRRELVADHYLSLVYLAQYMHEAIRMRRYSTSEDSLASLDYLITHAEEQIREAHIAAFGMEPAWWPSGTEEKRT